MAPFDGVAEPRATRLRAWIETCPTMVTRHAHPNACISTTRLALLSLDALGIRARPLTVVAAAYNAPFRNWIAANGRLPRSGDLPTIRMVLPDAWSKGTGGPTEEAPDRWEGHVVALIEDRILVTPSP